MTSVADSTSHDDQTEQDSENLLQTKCHSLLVWVDASSDQKQSELYLRKVTDLSAHIGGLKIFSNVTDCYDFLCSATNEQILLIASGSLGQILIPRVHQLNQLVSIYIFCYDVDKHSTWAKCWSKVRDVKTNMEDLGQSIAYLNQIHNCPISIGVIKSEGKYNFNSLDRLDQTFIYTLLLKKIILEMEFSKKAVKEFAGFCEEKFVNDPRQFEMIHQLKNKYKASEVIWWYTSETFLYPMLNRSLRLMEVDVILRMGFFIQDLHKKIHEIHMKQYTKKNQIEDLVVYRGQSLSKEEFTKILSTEGGFFSFNNYLSTTLKRNLAVGYACSSSESDNHVRVLFQIKIKPLLMNIPYALVNDYSRYKGAEQEILFSMHTIFRIGRISQTEEKKSTIWIIDLISTNACDEQLKVLMDQFWSEFRNNSPLESLAQLLMTLGHYKKAKDVYRNVWKKKNGNESSTIYHQMGWIDFNLGNYSTAIEYYYKSLKMVKKNYENDSPYLATLYEKLGLLHEKLGDYDESFDYYRKALEIYRAYSKNSLEHLAACLNNSSIVLRKRKEYAEAKSTLNEAFNITRNIFPLNHPFFISLYINQGLIHYELGNNEKALELFEQAFELAKATVPSDHPLIAECYQNIGGVLNNSSQEKQALTYHEKALDIYLLCLGDEHLNVATCYYMIACVHYKLHDYERTMVYHKKAFDMRERILGRKHPDFIASCEALAQVFENQSNWPAAVEHYQIVIDDLRSRRSNRLMLATNCHRLARILINMNEHEKAASFAQEAVNISVEALGPDPPDVQLYKQTLSMINQSNQVTRISLF